MAKTNITKICSWCSCFNYRARCESLIGQALQHILPANSKIEKCIADVSVGMIFLGIQGETEFEKAYRPIIGGGYFAIVDVIF
ncbi:hypothetical protein [sulfur-oxidizing endosymbiont of Gigantopelta aegis]|uniref:hypothetical protein n=1 Tax=sulfur-oxidizing endosymbiont of Gigantopelta aegis TaxID=2794934 RepID=UPI0018DBD798|nr:hypothetical protein [sulfur-oxidizing endosymbiont of Gigantopelta aegis]